MKRKSKTSAAYDCNMVGWGGGGSARQIIYDRHHDAERDCAPPIRRILPTLFNVWLLIAGLLPSSNASHTSSRTFFHNLVTSSSGSSPPSVSWASSCQLLRSSAGLSNAFVVLILTYISKTDHVSLLQLMWNSALVNGYKGERDLFQSVFGHDNQHHWQ